MVVLKNKPFNLHPEQPVNAQPAPLPERHQRRPRSLLFSATQDEVQCRRTRVDSVRFNGDEDKEVPRRCLLEALVLFLSRLVSPLVAVL